jgi:hypothetical protein
MTEAKKMTENEWQTASEPQAMLEFLHTSGRVSDRKLRLFAVACSRRVWGLIDALGHAAVDAAESFADGFASPEQMRAARLACQGAGGQAAWYAAATNPATAARNAARSAQAGAKALVGSDVEELLAQAALLRDIFCPMSFHPFHVDPSWLTPNVVKLAQAIYDERTFDRMSDLADALDKVGCNDADLLGHCRGSGPHVRGCWPVDLLLNKA